MLNNYFIEKSTRC